MSISVVIPAYNRESLIFEALESVRCQSLPPNEVLVVDDCSTDLTREAVREYSAKHGELPLRLIGQEQNRGVSAARNRGIREAAGEWIAFLDSDDMWVHNHLQGLADSAAKAGADVVFSRVRGFSDNDPTAAGKTWSAKFKNTDEVLAAMVFACHILPSAAMVRRQSLLELGCFDETADIQHAEDWDLWLRMIAAGSAFEMHDAFTCLYRQHDASACRNKSRLYRAVVCCLRKNFGKKPGSTEEWRSSLQYYQGKLGRALFENGERGACSALVGAWKQMPMKITPLLAAQLCVISALIPLLRPMALRFTKRFL